MKYDNHTYNYEFNSVQFFFFFLTITEAILATKYPGIIEID